MFLASAVKETGDGQKYKRQRMNNPKKRPYQF